MGSATAKLGALVATCAVLLAGCGGADTSTGSTSSHRPGSVSGSGGTRGTGSPGQPGAAGGGTGTGSTLGDPTPFLVQGAVMSYAFDGVDVLVQFNQCQRAALQHAADTLDSNLDPTKLCRQPAGIPCHGAGRYAGLAVGAPVLITNASGAVVAAGLLRQGHMSGRLVLGAPKVACAFGFEVPAVPGGSAGYTVTIGGTTKFPFTQAQAANVVVPIRD